MELPGTTLSISLVLYQAEPLLLRKVLSSLVHAIDQLEPTLGITYCQVYLVYNSDEQELSGPQLETMSQGRRPTAPGLGFTVLQGHGNIGYGRGHNLAIRQAESRYHLILNPDVILDGDSLKQGLRYLLENSGVTGLSPRVCDGAGQRQYTCKRYPSVLDFLLRGFGPAPLRRLFDRRLAHYEMRDLHETNPTPGIPIISGCFMLFRTEALQRAGGFDEAYFLYFEDFDLSLRMGDQGRLAYLPSMQITHLGGHAARKGLNHILMFIRSGLRFYNTHGWRLL